MKKPEESAESDSLNLKSIVAATKASDAAPTADGNGNKARSSAEDEAMTGQVVYVYDNATCDSTEKE
jgi:hypothetical protein